MTRRISACVGLFFALAAVTAHAQPGAEPPPPPPPGGGYAPPEPGHVPPNRGTLPGYHQHDGFYLRMNLGGGFTHFRSGDETAKGSAAILSIALGGAITPNLIIFGELFGASSFEPTFERNGVKAELDNVSLNTAHIGPGIAYYTPFNLYVTGTLGLSSTSIRYDDGGVSAEADSEPGIGGNVSIGYDWWVAANWAIGVTGRFYWSINKTDDDSDQTIKTFGGGIAFSATLN